MVVSTALHLVNGPTTVEVSLLGVQPLMQKIHSGIRQVDAVIILMSGIRIKWLKMLSFVLMLLIIQISGCYLECFPFRFDVKDGHNYLHWSCLLTWIILLHCNHQLTKSFGPVASRYSFLCTFANSLPIIIRQNVWIYITLDEAT